MHFSLFGSGLGGVRSDVVGEFGEAKQVEKDRPDVRAGSELGEQGQVDEEQSRKERKEKRDSHRQAQKLAR